MLWSGWSCLTLHTLRSILTIVLVTRREAELRLDCVTSSSSTARAPDDTMVSVHDFDTDVISSVCEYVQEKECIIHSEVLHYKCPMFGFLKTVCGLRMTRPIRL